MRLILFLLLLLAFCDGIALEIEDIKVNQLNYVKGNWYQYAIIDYNNEKEYLIIGFLIPKIGYYPENESRVIGYLGYRIFNLTPNPYDYKIDKNFLWLIPICGKNIKIDAIAVSPPFKSSVYEEYKYFKESLAKSLLFYYSPPIGIIYDSLSKYKPIAAAENYPGYRTIRKVKKYGLEVELIKITDKEKFSEFLRKYKYPEKVLEEIKKYNCNFILAKFDGNELPILVGRGIIYYVPGIYVEFETEKPWFPTKLTKLMGIDEIYVYTNNLVPNSEYKFNYLVEFDYNNVKANALLTIKTGEDVTFKKYDFESMKNELKSKIEYAKSLGEVFTFGAFVFYLALLARIFLSEFRAGILLFGSTFGLILGVMVLIGITIILHIISEQLFDLYYQSYNSIYLEIRNIINNDLVGIFMFVCFVIILILFSVLDIIVKLVCIYYVIKDFFESKNILPSLIVIVLAVIPIVLFALY